MTNKNTLERGHVTIIATLLFVFASLVVIYGISEPLIRQARTTSDAFTSRQSYFLAESGVEDTIARLKLGHVVAPSEVLTLNGSSATILTTDTEGGKQVVSQALVDDLSRNVVSTITLGEGVSFFYGVQVGQGGFIIANSSRVVGNVYSGGPIIGSNTASIDGDAVSSGPGGLITGMTVSGSAYAHAIENSQIANNAFYSTISGSTVGGTSYPGSADLPDESLPIDDTKIQEWENDALLGGVSTACNIISQNVTIGPKKYACSSLNISGTSIVTIAGPVWVEGDINVTQSAQIRVSPTLGALSGILIADDPSNPTTKGVILLSNLTQFFGTGHQNSYVALISMNTSAENGGSTAGITIDNNAQGELLLYAPHGEINLANAISIKEVTAYRLRATNSAEVIYETGLTSLFFSTGPSSGYSILEWREIE
jgi:hypothetical protein